MMGTAWLQHKVDKIFVGGKSVWVGLLKQFDPDYSMGIRDGRTYYYSDKPLESDRPELKNFMFVAGYMGIPANLRK